MGILLVDTNIVFEAVRTGIWNAAKARHSVVTVPECVKELRIDASATRRGYVPIPGEHLIRVEVRPLPELTAASFRLSYPNADGLDAGERDLLALAMSLEGAFELCSADKAAVRAAFELGRIDRVVSLESIAQRIGSRPKPELRVQYLEATMSQWRTRLTLGEKLG